MGCVYLVTNKINGRCYVGKTDRTLRVRKSEHLRMAKNIKDKTYFYKAIRKYGFINFKWRILFSSKNLDLLKEREIAFIKHFSTRRPKGYNLTNGGDGTSGRIISKETRRKISKGNKGKFISKSMRKAISLAHKGKKQTISQRKHRSKAMIGNKNSLGFKHPPEFGREISKRNKGKIFSKEHKENLSKSIKKYFKISENRQKISLARKGIKLSEKTKQKISEASIKHWKNPEYRKRVIEKFKGNQNAKGYKPTQEIKNKISTSLLFRKSRYDTQNI